MVRRATSTIRRSLAEMDRAFWCLHDHPAPLAALSAPTLLGLALIAAVVSAAVRNWDLSGFYVYLVYSVLCPTVVLWAITFLPLPCAVFVWFRARGDTPPVARCYWYVLSRLGRLFLVAVTTGLAYLFSFVLGGLPLLVLWPRMCLVPMVALFETERRVFRRSRRLLKEETAIHVLATVEVCVFVGLLATVFVPRLILATELFAGPVTQLALHYLWVFELMSGVVLATALAVSWCLSLTLLYHDIRTVREGEVLRERIRELRESLRAASSSA